MAVVVIAWVAQRCVCGGVSVCVGARMLRRLYYFQCVAFRCQCWCGGFDFGGGVDDDGVGGGVSVVGQAPVLWAIFGFLRVFFVLDGAQMPWSIAQSVFSVLIGVTVRGASKV